MFDYGVGTGRRRRLDSRAKRSVCVNVVGHHAIYVASKKVGTRTAVRVERRRVDGS